MLPGVLKVLKNIKTYNLSKNFNKESKNNYLNSIDILFHLWQNVFRLKNGKQ